LNLLELLSRDCLMGTGTDGASSLTGKQSGLVTKLSKLDGLTHSLHPQRLNLTVLRSMRNVKYLDWVDHMFLKMCRFYRNFSKRMTHLQNVSETLKYDLLRPQYLHTICCVTKLHW
jgi:hypothetical protein